MERIKRIALAAMLIAVISGGVACGRNNNTNNGTNATTATTATAGTSTHAPADNVGGTTNGMDNTTNGTNTTNANDNHGETGGVLRDMVNDVENGINNVAGDLETGTTHTTEGSTERR